MYIVKWEELGATSTAAFERPVAATIGVFDGVHSGHRRLLDAAAAWDDGPSVVVTFKQNPVSVLSPERYHGDVMTLDQKLQRFDELGLHSAVIIDFDRSFRSLSGKGFLETLRTGLPLGYLVVGHDFRCGRDLDTDADAIRDYLRPFGVRVDIVEALTDNERLISSTRIRNAVQRGDFLTVHRLMGRAFALDLRNVPTEQSDSWCSVARSSLKQVLPQAGHYKGVAHSADGAENIRIRVERETVSWSCSTYRNVTRIEFVDAGG